MNDHAPLAIEVRIAQEVIAQLHAAGITGDDPDFLTLLGNETELPERIKRILRAAVYTEAQSDALGKIIQANRERQDRLENKAARLRQIASWAMQEAGLKKLEAPDLSAALSAGKPPLIVNDVDAVPDDMCRIKRSPDRTRIRQAMADGLKPDWAYLGNPTPTLTIRTK